jgi:hypothetical protein
MKGAQIMTTASSTQSPATQALFRAAREGNVKGVHRALAAGADIEAKRKSDRWRWTPWRTPIQVAANKGHGDVVRALHAAGADYRGCVMSEGSARVVMEEIRAGAKRLDEARIVAEVAADPKAARALVEAVDAAMRAIPGVKERVRVAREAVAAAQAALDAAQAAWKEQDIELTGLEEVVGRTREVRLTAARRIVKSEDDLAVLRQAAGLDPADVPAVPAQRRTM